MCYVFILSATQCHRCIVFIVIITGIIKIIIVTVVVIVINITTTRMIVRLKL